MFKVLCLSRGRVYSVWSPGSQQVVVGAPGTGSQSVLVALQLGDGTGGQVRTQVHLGTGQRDAPKLSTNTPAG